MPAPFLRRPTALAGLAFAAALLGLLWSAGSIGGAATSHGASHPLPAATCSLAFGGPEDWLDATLHSAELVLIADVVSEHPATPAQREAASLGPARPAFTSRLQPIVVLVGALPEAPLEVAPLGVSLANCQGGPRLRPGERWLVFLERGSDSDFRRVPWWTMPALGYGQYRVTGPEVAFAAGLGLDGETVFDPDLGVATTLPALLQAIAARVPIPPGTYQQALALAGPGALPSAGSGGLADEDAGGKQHAMFAALSAAGLVLASAAGLRRARTRTRAGSR